MAKDLTEYFGHAKPYDTVKNLDDDEYETIYSNEVSAGQPEGELFSPSELAGNLRRKVTLVTESGLYSLIMLSNKPESREFKRWVTHEVLPTLPYPTFVQLNGGSLNTGDPLHGKSIVHERDGGPWFVAKDVCEILGTRTDDIPKVLDADEYAKAQVEPNTDTIGGPPRRPNTIISEPGLWPAPRTTCRHPPLLIQNTVQTPPFWAFTGLERGRFVVSEPRGVRRVRAGRRPVRGPPTPVSCLSTRRAHPSHAGCSQ
ncbi:hypothetical protein GCM10023214_10910 [Amycolatopsis dongchuanensis]|uniref:Bro-N domain-containing protein n=1 Tax=Amycolatopsis dongchuanensis TaxID=1070866 RepID=A0ABP9Q0U2_9PSEU